MSLERLVDKRIRSLSHLGWEIVLAVRMSQLQVIWLDTDDGLHKRLCNGIEFPNAHVLPVDSYFPKLLETSDGAEITRQFDTLRALRGNVP